MTNDRDMDMDMAEAARSGAQPATDVHYPVPDLDEALRRRHKRQRRWVGALAGVAILSVAVAALALGTSRDGSTSLTAGVQDGPTELVLLDGTRLDVDLPRVLADAAPLRVDGSSRLLLAGDCCEYPNGEFSQDGGIPSGTLVDEWTNESGLELQTYRQKDQTLVATSIVGRFRLLLRMPALEAPAVRKALAPLSVHVVEGGWPVVAPKSLSTTLPVSASLDLGPAEPLITVARSDCDYAGVRQPDDADFPTAQRCFGEAGVEITAQRSGSDQSGDDLESLLQGTQVNRM